MFLAGIEIFFGFVAGAFLLVLILGIGGIIYSVIGALFLILGRVLPKARAD